MVPRLFGDAKATGACVWLTRRLGLPMGEVLLKVLPRHDGYRSRIINVRNRTSRKPDAITSHQKFSPYPVSTR